MQSGIQQMWILMCAFTHRDEYGNIIQNNKEYKRT
jgi:hypothetical protein